MTKLELARDNRAALLLDRLDARYFEFAGHLPPPLKELALRKSTYQGRQTHLAFEGFSKLNPILASTPWLFWETFCGLDDEAFLGIAAAGAFHSLAMVVMDHLVDGQAERAGSSALLHQALHREALRGFQDVFSLDSSFWDEFDRLSRDYLSGMAEELDLRSNPDRLNFEGFKRICSGKVSSILATLAGLGVASKQADVMEPIEASLKDAFCAAQLLDDIGDWQSDYRAGRLTYFLTCLAPPEGWQAGKWLSNDELQGSLNAEWTDVSSMRQVTAWLEAAIQSVDGVGCSGWIEYLKDYKRLTKQHLEAAVARHLKRTLGPEILQAGAHAQRESAKPEDS